DVYEARNDPVPFTPPLSALKNADGTRRYLSDKTIAQLQAAFDGRTSVQADKIIGKYLDNWIAITGRVSDVRREEETNTIYVPLQVGWDKTISLSFAAKWAPKLLPLNPADRIYAICKFGSLGDVKVELLHCEPTRPAK